MASAGGEGAMRRDGGVGLRFHFGTPGVYTPVLWIDLKAKGIAARCVERCERKEVRES
jgi:hypothetical protein